LQYVSLQDNAFTHIDKHHAFSGQFKGAHIGNIKNVFTSFHGLLSTKGNLINLPNKFSRDRCTKKYPGRWNRFLSVFKL